MSLRDFLLLLAVCLIWAFSNVLSKIVVGDWGVPPLFFAAIRFALVFLCTLPWLLPAPRPLWRILTVGICMGAGNFAFLFLALKHASPSAVAIVVQAGVPITTLLSVLVLHERIRWRRGLGIALTLVGVLIVIWRPGVALSLGMVFALGAAFAGAIGAITMKQMENVEPIRFQAWVGLASFLPLGVASALFEPGAANAAWAAGWPFIAALVFSALIVSIGAHTAYYGLIAKYEANMIAPLTLMTPLATIGFGMWLTGDQLDARMVIGASLALLGVLIIALRRTSAPVAQAQEHS